MGELWSIAVLQQLNQGPALSPDGLETTSLTEIHFQALAWSQAWTKQSAAYQNTGRSKAMAVNKNNPLSHWAGGTAAPHTQRHQTSYSTRQLRVPGQGSPSR